MNILFVNYTYPIPTSGGTERVIDNLSRYFREVGISSHVLFFEGEKGKNSSIVNSLNFTDLNSLDEIKEYIISNNIKIIIIFKKYLDKRILNVLRQKDCKIIYSLRYSIDDSRLKNVTIINNNHLRKSFTWKLKKCFAGLYIKYVEYVDKKKISLISNYSDSVVLLSSRIIDDFIIKYKVSNPSKVNSISNALTYDSFLSDTELDKKQNILLVVARMEEKSKRIFLLLEIWTIITQKYNINDWALALIGDGSDLGRYQAFVQNIGIRNVVFLGRMNPEAYYRKSAIFAMTSSAEGFGMTLIEAQQMGCVPVAFNSFLSLHDIIDDGENGYIIENNNLELYVDKLYNLMHDSGLRRTLAINAIQKSKDFRIEKIGRQWVELFNELIEQDNK